jgi:hypothetical protein
MPMPMTVAATSTATTTMRQTIPMTTIPITAPREVTMTAAAAAARGILIPEVTLAHIMNRSALVVGRVPRAFTRS